MGRARTRLGSDAPLAPKRAPSGGRAGATKEPTMSTRTPKRLDAMATLVALFIAIENDQPDRALTHARAVLRICERWARPRKRRPSPLPKRAPEPTHPDPNRRRHWWLPL